MTRLSIVRRIALYILRVHVDFTNAFDRIEAGEPVVLTANHQSLLDGFIIAIIVPRQIHFGVTPRHAEKHWLTALLLRIAAGLRLVKIDPIHPDRPFALRSLKQTVDQKGIAMLFPEGRICNPHEKVEPKGGAEWIAKKSDRRIVSISIDGANNRWFFSPSGRSLLNKISIRI